MNTNLRLVLYQTKDLCIFKSYNLKLYVNNFHFFPVQMAHVSRDLHYLKSPLAKKCFATHAALMLFIIFVDFFMNNHIWFLWELFITVAATIWFFTYKDNKTRCFLTRFFTMQVNCLSLIITFKFEFKNV